MSSDEDAAINTVHDQNNRENELVQVLNEQPPDTPMDNFEESIIFCRISIPLSLINRIQDETAPRHVYFLINDERGDENLIAFATYLSRENLDSISHDSIVCLWEFRQRNLQQMLNSITQHFGVLIAGILLSLSEPHFPPLIKFNIDDGNIQYDEIERHLSHLSLNS